MYQTFNDGSDFSERLSASFLSAAWSEELLKFIILYFIVLRRNEFNEPMDGIVYGVTVSLGLLHMKIMIMFLDWPKVGKSIHTKWLFGDLILQCQCMV